MVADPHTTPSESTRTYVSLLLFMHLFCVVVVLSGNHYPSRLQSKLAKTLGIYTKTLHLDPGLASFELTDGERGLTQLHQWEVLKLSDSGQDLEPDDDAVLKIPNARNAAKSWLDGGFQHSRGDMYSRLAAYYASSENTDDEVCAAMARDLAAHYFATGGQRQNADRLLVRCVSLVDDETIYEVDAWRTDAGNLQILKRMEARRTAPSN